MIDIRGFGVSYRHPATMLKLDVETDTIPILVSFADVPGLTALKTQVRAIGCAIRSLPFTPSELLTNVQDMLTKRSVALQR
jgi:hypothetical protein